MTAQHDAFKDALRETEERFRALIENSSEGILLIDAAGKILYVSPADERILGRLPEEAMGKVCFAWVHPEDMQSTQELLGEVLANPRRTYSKELRALHKDGSWRWIRCSARNLLDHTSVRGIVINYHDITDSKTQELEAQRQRECFETIVRATHDVVWDWDLVTNAVWWNEEFYNRFGYADIPPTPEFWVSLIHPSERTQIERTIYATFESKENYWTGEYRFRHANGDYSDVFDRGFIMRDKNGKPVRMLGTMMDFSERKSAELKMQKLAAFVRYNPNPVFEFSAKGEVTYFNEASQRLATLVGKNDPIEIIPPEVNSLVEQCLETGQPKPDFISSINTRTICWWLYPMADCKVVHCYAADITDRVKMEEQLRQSSKMEAIGQLAGGVAHDFNNLLTVIKGHAALLELDATLDENSSESIQEISLAAERASNLTRQLLTFSRKQVIQPCDINCNDVVHNITRMLQRILGEDVGLQVNYDPSLPLVHADAGMLEQVLVNLAVNSRDAMPQGGRLIIETGTHVIDAAYCTANPEASVGRSVCLSVRDSGLGIRPEDLPRVFEPFFTTKEVGKGTGLGLATVYGIVKQHKGWITVDSKLAHGTTFNIFLPAASATRSTAPAIREKKNVRGNETILLVEDEATVRKLTRSVLELYGYKVIEAATGKEAFLLWQQQRKQIDLVLTDMVMPDGMSGRELVELVRLEQPDAKAFFVSGYSGDFTDKGNTLKEGVNFLQKPYHPQELGEAIRQCLDRTDSGTFSPR